MRLLRFGSFFLFLSLAISGSASATYQWGFANVSVNYLNWDAATEEKSPKRDFVYLELEGGGQFNWGEAYGFFDLENIGHESQEMRTAGKGILRYYLGKTGFSLYGHIYNFTASGFSEQNRVAGLGYQLPFKNGWFNPFLGVHDVSQTYFTGLNGYMGGWILGYSFKLGKEDFIFTNWHELEFDRDAAYAAGNGGKKLSHNGAAAVWWMAIPRITFGLQWRYASDKLGTPGAMNAGILSLKLNF